MSGHEFGDALPVPPDQEASAVEEIVRKYDEYTSFSSTIIENDLAVKCSGDIDLYSAATLKELIVDQLANNPEIIRATIDLTQTRFIDSTTLGILVGLAKKIATAQIEAGMAERVPVRILVSSLNVTAVFEITGLEKVFDIIKPSDENS